ncbi:MAG: type II toxin-antitoxin system PemK/MazF family toxin [Candidatus Saccharimonadales bacterium]
MIHRSQIYWVQLDPTIGSEIKKTRPALVVSNDTNNRVANTVTVLPLSSQIKVVGPFEVLLPAGAGGLKVASKAKANQIRTVDKQRLSASPLGGVVDTATLGQINTAIKIHLEISG